MSENLRKKVNELLVRTMNELKEMYDAVNLSMNKRVMETSTAKKNLTDHLKRVGNKINASNEEVSMEKSDQAPFVPSISVSLPWYVCATLT